MRVQIALVGRRFLLAGKFPYKRRDVPLDSHGVIGLTRILLLMFRASSAAQKLSQSSKSLSSGLTKARDQKTHDANRCNGSGSLQPAIVHFACDLGILLACFIETKMVLDGYIRSIKSIDNSTLSGFRERQPSPPARQTRIFPNPSTTVLIERRLQEIQEPRASFLGHALRRVRCNAKGKVRQPPARRIEIGGVLFPKNLFFGINRPRAARWVNRAAAEASR
jgi:hypothetical protein